MNSDCCNKPIVRFGRNRPHSTQWYGCSECQEAISSELFYKIVNEDINIPHFKELKGLENIIFSSM